MQKESEVIFVKRIRICYPAIFSFDQEVNSYAVQVPDMEQVPCGCSTCGDTFEEACEKAEEAIGFALEEVINDNYPTPSRPESFNLDPGEFVVPIWYDSMKYAQAVSKKSVSRTISLPEWLDDLAQAEHLRYSKILQRALKKELGIEEDV